MRAHRAERGRRAGGAIGHLLLVVVLALGCSSCTRWATRGLRRRHGHRFRPAPRRPGAGRRAASRRAAAAAPHHGDSSDARHEPGAGMDMTTLCVAVLGAWLLAGLVRAALGRRPTGSPSSSRGSRPRSARTPRRAGPRPRPAVRPADLGRTPPRARPRCP
ncbi:hypothetical protein O1L60_34360 [Streptomyces diastatochromogenes]|nr:hypothetical protein [Streptomyces diastatochromogenes]